MLPPPPPPSLTLLPGRAHAVKKIGGVLGFSALAAWFGYRAILTGHKVDWFLFIFDILIVLGMLPSTIRVLRRTPPVLTADADGIAASIMMGDISRIPWPDVAGIETYTADKQKYIVITGLTGPDAVPGLHAFAKGVAKGLNKKSKLPGLIYIPARLIDLPADAAADQLRQVALAHIEQSEPPR